MYVHPEKRYGVFFMSEKKKTKWMRFRHRIVRNIAYLVLYPYCRIVYGVRVEKFKQQAGRQYLILLNHQTPFDQFFVGMSFKGPIYYLATEDIFSMGFLSGLIKYLVAPIPIKKQTTDLKAVLTCMRVAKEGGTICIAPEGNRTYSGRTEYMNPAIVPLVKKLSLPLALYRLEGGYGVQPRWSDVIRKGKMRAYVSRVVEPEEYKAMSDEELMQLISTELYVNEACLSGEFHHSNRAEFLERCIYVCPFCGLSHFYSASSITKCQKCGREVEYLPTKEIQGIGYEHPFRFVAEWYDYQQEFINNLDILSFTEKPVYTEHAAVYEVVLYKNKHILHKDAVISLYGDRITVNDTVFDFASASHLTVLGKNKLNIYHGGKVYQLKGDEHFNALKYLHFCYRYKNLTTGAKNDKFLGL